jgi:hypothetical protein
VYVIMVNEMIRKRIVAAAVVVAAGAAPSSGSDDGLHGLHPSERRLELHPLPTQVELSRYKVTVQVPEDPDIRAGGGAGGPIIEIRVEQLGASRRLTTYQQAIGLWVADRGSKPPAFSVWSKTGVSDFVHCRLQLRRAEYCAVYCEDYEQTGEGLRRTRTPRRAVGCEG